MFQFISNNSSSSLLIEEVRFDIDKLLEIVDLNKTDEEQYIKFKNSRRKKEWLAVRYLLKKLCKDDISIKYNSDGKPFLSNGKNISISHSGNYIGIIVSDIENIGLDIEKISNKLDKIKHKFLNQFELDLVSKSKNPVETLAMFWCAKEAMYKLYSKKNLIFDEQLLINSVDLKNNKIFAKIKTTELIDVELSFKKIDEYFFVWSY